uniref:NADH-ubiquinone oxidoreductase chain 4L n=1 Tax=Choeras grammatitergitus TaxID=1911502 RepID=A0A6F8AA32_9HYME|nr:NADH dehydrogenase subunit 4L [Choeras grammatitergitus]
MYMNWQFNMSFILFIISTLMFSSLYKHLLMSLISLEFMVLNLSYMIYLKLSILKMNLYFISLFWTICVCESILGLTILVFLVRKMGNDYTKLLNLIF